MHPLPGMLLVPTCSLSSRTMPCCCPGRKHLLHHPHPLLLLTYLPSSRPETNVRGPALGMLPNGCLPRGAPSSSCPDDSCTICSPPARHVSIDPSRELRRLSIYFAIVAVCSSKLLPTVGNSIHLASRVPTHSWEERLGVARSEPCTERAARCVPSPPESKLRHHHLSLATFSLAAFHL